jgi:D-sedoheptulose 7-phosphate isomerase
MKDLIYNDLQEAREELRRFLEDDRTIDSIAAAADLCAAALRAGHKIISCGNGGSLCDATHFAEELTGRYRGDRRSLPAIAINDPAYLTCTANDYSFEEVFSRYVGGLGDAGDVLLAISTSGESPDVLAAARAAREKGMKVVALTAPAGKSLERLSDVAVCAPSAPYSDRIQEIHIKVIHILIHAIESDAQLRRKFVSL